MKDFTMRAAIITAVLTGIFTVLAGVVTYWITNKQPELGYTITGGPALPALNGSKRIFVVEVVNSGSKEIAQAYIRVSLPAGEFSEIAAEATPGVQIREDKLPRQLEIKSDLLNPGDTIKIAALIAQPFSGMDPAVIVRAPGVKAIDQTKKTSEFWRDAKYQSALLVLISSVAAAIASLILRPRSTVSRALGISTGGFTLDQSELCAYICGSYGLAEEADRLRFGGSEITYRGAADYLKLRALRLPLGDRQLHIRALRALLFQKKLTPQSIGVIVKSIEELGGAISSDEVDEIRSRSIEEGVDSVGWRSLIDASAKDSLG